MRAGLNHYIGRFFHTPPYVSSGGRTYLGGGFCLSLNIAFAMAFAYSYGVECAFFAMFIYVNLSKYFKKISTQYIDK